MRRDIVETTQTLHGNMNKMLERGDKVENLVRKSEVLKSSADMFKRIVKKRAPTPPKGASDKIKTSFALTAIALILVAVTVGTNQLITVKVYPQNSADYPTPIDNIATCVTPAFVATVGSQSNLLLVGSLECLERATSSLLWMTGVSRSIAQCLVPLAETVGVSRLTLSPPREQTRRFLG